MYLDIVVLLIVVGLAVITGAYLRLIEPVSYTHLTLPTSDLV